LFQHLPGLPHPLFLTLQGTTLEEATQILGLLLLVLVGFLVLCLIMIYFVPLNLPSLLLFLHPKPIFSVTQ
jgi:hypothetical protein